MYLLFTTRLGVSGKELQRQLGVTYKTGCRIGQQVREQTAEAGYFDALLSGHVEIDEAYIAVATLALGMATIAPARRVLLASSSVRAA